MRRRIIVILFVLLSTQLFTQTVNFVEEIQIKGKSSLNRTLSKFIFGEKKIRIQPAGICILDNGDIALTDTTNQSVAKNNNNNAIV